MFFDQITLKIIAVVFIVHFNTKFEFVTASYTRNPVRPSIRLSAPAKPIYGEHISLRFYAAAENAEKAKEILQSLLQNFIENAERNLTTSTVLKSDVSLPETDETHDSLNKLNSLSDYFKIVSEKATKFSLASEQFFEITKNETSSMLLKLRKVPSVRYFLHRDVKVHLTDYFSEMESLYVQLTEVLDDGIDYITSTLHATARNFADFAGLQKYALEYFKPSVLCCKRYKDYIQQLLPDIFKCSAGQELHTAYVIYATTAWTSKYILRQLEFRIERLFNCFIFDSYKLRCRFLRNAEEDFQKLFEKVEELKIFYDIRMRKGQVSKMTLQKYGLGAHMRHQELWKSSGNDNQLNSYKKECIPNDFTNTVRNSELRTCFRFSA